MSGFWRLAGLLLLACLLASTACRGACSNEALATLERAEGSVERDYARSVDHWSAAEAGAEFSFGDGIRTGEASKALLLLDDGSRAALSSKTQVRFLRTPPGFGGAGLDLVVGQAVVHVGEEPLRLMTGVGSALLEPQSKLSLKKSAQGVRFDVSVGRAEFETGEGKTSLSAGQGLTIDVGRAIVERSDDKPGPRAPDAPSSVQPGAEQAASDGGSSMQVELEKVGTEVQAPGEKQWQKLSPGSHRVEAGSRFRLAAGAAAGVSQGQQRANLKGAGEFVVGAPGAAFVQTNSGVVRVDKQQSTVQVAAPGGLLVIKRGSVADVQAHAKKGTDVEVALGEVEVRTKERVETVRTGEAAHLDIAGTLKLSGRGPTYADLFIEAGESVTIHDPKPPTAVGVRLVRACPAGGLVELAGAGAKHRSRGDTAANILLPVGQHRYKLRCIGEGGVASQVAVQGTIAIRHDSGMIGLPKSAARTLVDMDGRHYTVLYQSVLPEIAVRWRRAPASNSYRLVLVGPGVTKIVESATPHHTFGSGQLPEGTHRLTFEGGGSRSPGTTLSIRFDNAAPMARITSPIDGSFSRGSVVTVVGISLPGWTASVAGKALEHDAASRFSGQAAAPADQRALVIQLSHPSRGVRYYLRRSAETAK